MTDLASKRARSMSALHTQDSIGLVVPQNATYPAMKKRKIIVRSIDINPSDYIKSAFRANGISIDVVKEKAESVFMTPTPQMLQAYKPDLLNAVRKNEMDKLKEFHAAGKLINCCNKFGESLLHLACRRSHTEVVRFLLREGNVNIHIRDDYRRTPLHDACWTIEPNFDLMDMLLEEAPEHLLLEDVRGFTPFDYVRREHRGKWLHFLWKRKAKLRPLGTPQNNSCQQKEEEQPKVPVSVGLKLPMSDALKGPASAAADALSQREVPISAALKLPVAAAAVPVVA